jgi:hypothetical protein
MKSILKIILFIIFLENITNGQELEVSNSNGVFINYNTRIGAPIVLNQGSGDRVLTPTRFVIMDPTSDTEKLSIEYKNVLKYVLGIYSKIIVSNQPINVLVKKQDLGTVTLANCVTTSYYNSEQSPFQPNYQYHIALAEAIKDVNLNSAEAEMIITVNINNSIVWNLDTTGVCVSNKYDLATVLMHEVLHGLGFTSSIQANKDNFTAISKFNGCQTNTEGYFSTIYDKYIVQENYITAQILAENSNTYSMYNNCIDGSVYYSGINTNNFLNAQGIYDLPKIYAPSEWATGSSICHLDENTYPAGNTNSLITPNFGLNEVNHSIGEIAAKILEDLGWTINTVITITNPTNISEWTRGETYNLTFTSNKPLNTLNYAIKNNNNVVVHYGTAAIVEGNNQIPIQLSPDCSIDEYRFYFYNSENVLIGRSEKFKIVPRVVSTPLISPASGNYFEPIEVELTCSTPGAQIYYSTSGDPSNFSTLYAGKFYLVPNEANPTITLKAVAYKDGYTRSSISSQVYKYSGVKIKQVSSDNVVFGHYDEYKNNVWISRPSNTAVPKMNPTIIRADTNYQSNIQEKFRHFKLEGATPSILYQNWYSADLINSAINEITAQYKKTYLTTIQTTIDGFFVNLNGSLKFKDPWLMMESDNSAKGRQNKGLYPTWVTVNSPFVPDYTTSQNGYVYKGIFLNEGADANRTPPYYSIGLNSNISFNNKPCYFVKWKQNQINGQNSAEIAYINSLETPIIFKQANSVITAELKGTNISNNVNTYSANSQRKIIRTSSDNYLHSVYESMGMVWYERSTDNGVTWKIMNNGSPLSQNNAKNPCLISNGEYMVIIAFQEQNGDEFKIRIQSFNYIDDIILANYSREIHKPYTDECHPAISRAAYNSFYKIMVAWEEKDGSQWWPAGGIYYIIGDLNYTGTQFSFSDGANLAINTDQTCSNPTLMGNNAYPAHFNLAYQQNITNSSSKIWYHHIGIDNNGIPTDATRQEVSYGSGYTKNYNPSIIEINNGARVVWVGERESAGIDRPTTVEGTGVSVLNKTSTTTEKSVVFKSPSYYRFWYFGNNVQGPTITRSNDNLAYVIAWNETNNNSNKFVDNNLTTIKNFNLAGNYVQVANGATKQDMIGMVFDSRTAPYFFTKTNNIGSYYPKLMPGIVGINYGRQGLVKKDSSQIYFRIGDIWNNGESVNFLQVPEEYITNGLESLNNILISEPFEISDGESFIYSVQYGLVESGASKLGANNYINFKVKLIEANTGETLRIFDNVTYSDTDYEQYNNLLYQVNVNGIGNKEVKLCLEIVSNSVAEYFVADKVSDEDIMAKANIKQVELTQEIEINSYDLYQNYPNPFNPTTNITYQIPKDGHVSLKIYDVLGKEIITLVEEQKTRGKYTVTFDGSNLASGVYIYRLETGNFVSTKKLMLMK